MDGDDLDLNELLASLEEASAEDEADGYTIEQVRTYALAGGDEDS